MEKIVSRATYFCLILFLFCQSVFAQTDINWLRQIHSNQARPADGIMNGISQTTYPIAIALPATELIYGYIKHDKKSIRNGLGTCVALGINLAISYGLKYSVNRTRPYDTYTDIIPYKRDDDPSFPSGHTSFAFNTATTISLHYPKWYIIVPAYVWAGTVGYSRLYMGMHYPSDVFVGAIVGAGSSFLAYKGQQWLLKKKNKTIHKPVE